jgi:hypothetical protein
VDSRPEREAAFLEAATAAGLPAAALARALAKGHDHHRAIAALLVDAVRDEVWRPFVDAGLPSERMRALADTVDRLRDQLPRRDTL